jgi:thiamine-phosphate pyrophosphorylase
MHLPRLYPILDTLTLEGRGYSPVEAARVLLDSGVGILQYRHKAFFTEDRYQEAKRIAGLCRAVGALFVFNDRADFAALLQSGLHVGQDDLPPAAARTVLGDGLPLGFSTHNEPQLRASAGQPIDYVALGPIFGTGSKENPDPQLGLAELKRLRPLASVPLVAIGGITFDTAESVLQSGADSIALISDLFPPGEPDPQALRRRTLQWLELVNS